MYLDHFFLYSSKRNRPVKLKLGCPANFANPAIKQGVSSSYTLRLDTAAHVGPSANFGACHRRYCGVGGNIGRPMGLLVSFLRTTTSMRGRGRIWSSSRLEQKAMTRSRVLAHLGERLLSRPPDAQEVLSKQHLAKCFFQV